MSENDRDRKYVRLLAAALAVGLSIAGILPARSQNLTLEASPALSAQPGETVTLTARADQRVTAPNFLMIVDAYNAISLNACRDTDVCTATVSSNIPVGPGQVAYAAAIGTDATHPLAYNGNGCCYVSWLFSPKLYAFRFTATNPPGPSGFDPTVRLYSDGGGAPTGRWRISIFNSTNGALVQECQYTTLCTGVEDNTSGAYYQSVVSLGGTDIRSALQNDLRTYSKTKCVDPPDLTTQTFCAP